MITLDADTTLPHDAARRMIATLAHPLNAPVYDRTPRTASRRAMCCCNLA